uniref:Exostosin GT47 domain-containing protein n=1 Tax=Kalanchoe fedtschenkoi TaxID=63787 RepID=A0A7N0T1I1_KALFE
MLSVLLLTRTSFIVITTQIFLLLFLSSLSLLRHHPSSSSPRVSPAILPPPVVEERDECPLGRIYVYELPRSLNRDIVRLCSELNPWTSRCEILQNHGFGKPAASELNGVVPDSLLSSWYATDQFVSELIFHNKLLRHRCRAPDADSAAAFYVPFYAGLAVGKYLWSSRFTSRDRDRHCESLRAWLEQQPSWRRSDGWDHFLTMGRISWDFRRSHEHDWGSSCIHMAFMRNVTRLLIERNPWDYFDVGVPYPTGFHPDTAEMLSAWQSFVRQRSRSHLFSFAGAKRANFKDDFRSLLFNQCSSEAFNLCRAVDCSAARCSNGTSAIKAFLDSHFCLQPRGDSFTRRSIFDCMIAGSIPVFFWRRTAYLQYQWFLPPEPESYSVFIDRHGVRNGTITVKSVLEKFSKDDVERMRDKVIENIPNLVYSKPDEGLGSVQDAFDVAIDGILNRIKDQQQPGYKW